MCGDIIVWMGTQQNNKLNVNVVLVYGPFWMYLWAVLNIHVGRFRPGYGPFLPFVWAVLVHGPFWYRPQPVSTSLNKFTNSEVELCGVGSVNAPVGRRDPFLPRNA